MRSTDEDDRPTARILDWTPTDHPPFPVAVSLDFAEPVEWDGEFESIDILLSRRDAKALGEFLLMLAADD